MLRWTSPGGEPCDSFAADDDHEHDDDHHHDESDHDNHHDESDDHDDLDDSYDYDDDHDSQQTDTVVALAGHRGRRGPSTLCGRIVALAATSPDREPHEDDDGVGGSPHASSQSWSERTL